MTATPITSNQNKQFRRLYEDTGVRAFAAVDQLDKDGLQTLIERGGEFQDYVLEGVRKFSVRGPVFPVYLDIDVGGKDKKQFLKELKSAGMFASKWAEDIMGKPAWKPGEKERVQFARVKVRDLGFTKNPTTHELWARIRELGHSLCEPGDGPAIRLALTDQSRGDYFWCAMEQIAGSDGLPGMFRVERHDGGESWLFTNWVRPGNRWDLVYEIVFRLRK